jgi:hypothetical protein
MMRFEVLTAASMRIGCLLGCCDRLMMEATSTSETSVNIYQTTRRNSPEDSHLHCGKRFHNSFNFSNYNLIFPVVFSLEIVSEYIALFYQIACL